VEIQIDTELLQRLRERDPGKTDREVLETLALEWLGEEASDRTEPSSADPDASSDDEMAPLPEGWGITATGEPMPNVVAAVRRSREGH
jgi:hypothetical protein